MKLSEKLLSPGLILKIKLGVFILIPAAMFFFPLHSLDSMPTLCLFKLATGHECPGCGMTHAVLSIFHFHFAEAFNYNKLVVLIFPLLSYIWVRKIVFDCKKLKDKSNNKNIKGEIK